MPQTKGDSGALGPTLRRLSQFEPAQGRADLTRLLGQLEAFAADPDPAKRGTSAKLLAKLRPQLEELRPSG